MLCPTFHSRFGPGTDMQVMFDTAAFRATVAPAKIITENSQCQRASQKRLFQRSKMCRAS
jgi:hypothetical protein